MRRYGQLMPGQFRVEKVALLEAKIHGYGVPRNRIAGQEEQKVIMKKRMMLFALIGGYC